MHIKELGAHSSMMLASAAKGQVIVDKPMDKDNEHAAISTKPRPNAQRNH
jgi:hypothetical protein